MSHRLGSVIARLVPLSGEDLDRAARHQLTHGLKFGEALRALNLCSEDIIQLALKQQQDSRAPRPSLWAELHEYLHELAHFRRPLALLLLLVVMSACISRELILAKYLNVVIGRVITLGAPQVLLQVTGIALLVLFAACVMQYGVGYLASLISARFNARLTERLFDHIHALPAALFARQDKHSMQTAMTEGADQVSRATLYLLQNGIRSAVLLVIVLFVAASYHPGLLLAALPLFFCMAVLPQWVSKPATPALEAEPAHLARIAGFVDDILAVPSFIRLLPPAQLQRRAESLLDSHYLLQVKKWMHWSNGTNTKITFNLFLSAALIWGGGTLIFAGKMDLATFIPMFLLLNFVIPKVDELYESLRQIQTLRAQWKQVARVLALPVDPRRLEVGSVNQPRVDVHAIELRNLGYRYVPDGPDILGGIDLTLHKGKVYSLCGPSGCGKSTLAKLVLGLYAPSSGQVLYDGESVCTMHPREIARRTGLLEQDPFLLPDRSIAFNIHAGLSTDANGPLRDEIQGNARLALIDHKICSLDEGYDSLITANAADLSGGERQRLCLARMFARDAAISVYDEPTSALDAELADGIYEAILAQAPQRITLIITHDPELAKRTDFSIEFTPQGIVCRENTPTRSTPEPSLTAQEPEYA